MSEQPQTYEVEASYNGIRTDKYLSLLFPELSRAFLQKLIKQGHLSVNGKCISKVSHALVAGDCISITIPKVETVSILPQDIPITILYEDNDIMIVDKEKGMVVHPSAGHATDTLVNAIMYHCKDRLSGINGELRPGIVHRIDKDTTGALIICKNDFAHQKIAEQLKEHSITRKYVGIVYGNFDELEGVVDGPIGRHSTDRKKMAIQAKNGKPARTHYKVLEQFPGYSYIQFELETGRTHQIRVHMASIHHPLLGDTVYTSRKCEFKHLVGQTLHAQIIGFLHPTTGIYQEYEAPLPDYFQNLLSILRARA